MRTQLGPMSLDLKVGCAETTHDVPGDHPPFTLARQSRNACGAFQFSIALYNKGRLPCAKGADLQKLLVDFAESHELGTSTDAFVQDEPLPLAAATFSKGNDMIRVWYVSDGASFAKATYLAVATDDYSGELADCEQMIRTVTFEYAGRPT
jgi:hypothetical protein